MQSDDDITEEEMSKNAAERAEEFRELGFLDIEADVTEDINQAFMDHPLILHIHTGKFRPDGTPIKIRARAVNPSRPELALAYLASQGDKEAMEAASFDMVQDCIIEPTEILSDAVGKETAWGNWKRLSRAFRAHISFHCLNLMGVNGDFLDMYARLVPPSTLRAARTSSTPLRGNLADSQARSDETSPLENSGRPSAILKPTENSNASSSSKTSASSSPT